MQMVCATGSLPLSIIIDLLMMSKRFSRRSLIVAIPTLGSAILLWVNWEPWEVVGWQEHPYTLAYTLPCDSRPALSPDGHWLVRKIRGSEELPIFNLNTGQEVGRLAGHCGNVNY